MKKFLAFVLAIVMVLALCACGQQAAPAATKAPEAPAQAPAETEAPAAEKHYEFNFGTVDTEEHPTTMAAHKIGEYLEEKAPGRWTINVYPNSTLGGAAELVESVQMGNVDMACPASSFVANYAPSVGVLDLPFMFTNREQAYAVLDGEVGQSLMADVEAIGIKPLTYWEVGFRCLANAKRAINTVDDVAGLRMRIVNGPVHQALFTALGVDPVPMGLADALVANQQGTIDGMDNPLSGLYTTSVYEFDKYITVTNHVYTAQMVIMSQKAWDSMDPADQELFMEAVRASTEFDREEQLRQTEAAAANLQEKGCEISYPDLTGFVEKMDAVYEQFPEYADSIAKIREVTAAIG